MKDKQNNLYGLLEQVSTQQLDAMLQAELQKKQVDGDAVRVILRVLREREEDMPVVIDDATEQAWQKYLRDTAVSQKPAGKRGWILRAAAMAAVLCVVLLIGPLTANAERIYGMLTRWTDSIFEFFDPNDKNTNPVEYEFKTDNPGLQQVYDAVVELGVTDPVVPMWLPEGFELVEIKVTETSRNQGVIALFANESADVVFRLRLHEDDMPRVYHKDETYVATFEFSGVLHDILKNNESWTIVWTQGNIECVLSADCQEDVVRKMIHSIYVEEDK